MRQPPDTVCATLYPLPATARSAASSSAETVHCSVCMCDCPSADCSTNGCGHTFCNDCWLSHLAVQIGDGKARHTTCMAFKCGVVADEQLVTRLMLGECVCGVGREGRAQNMGLAARAVYGAWASLAPRATSRAPAWGGGGARADEH